MWTETCEDKNIMTTINRRCVEADEEREKKVSDDDYYITTAAVANQGILTNIRYDNRKKNTKKQSEKRKINVN